MRHTIQRGSGKRSTARAGQPCSVDPSTRLLARVASSCSPALLRRGAAGLVAAAVCCWLAGLSCCRAADEPPVDLAKLPPNTWVPLRYTTEQLAGSAGQDPEQKGSWGTAGWNKLVYDPDGRRVLFYDRWLDKRHGGGTIYGNCLFAFDPARGVVTPLKVDNWTVQRNPSSYWTIALAENASVPTPCPRHVYNAFDYVSAEKALYIANGANGTAAVDGKLVWEKECENTWRLDLTTLTWSQLPTESFPRNDLEAAMAYCPDIRSLVYTGKGKLWLFDLEKRNWRKAKSDVPTHGGGQTIFYDPPRKRMLIAGGVTTDPSVAVPHRKQRDKSCDKLYALDPVSETITPLADCPTALNAAGLAYDSRHDVFVTAVTIRFPEDGLPSGTFVYEPKQDRWLSIAAATPAPDPKYWAGWMRMCYDEANDCFVGLLIYDRWYALRYNGSPEP